jgi:hypothetical protein
MSRSAIIQYSGFSTSETRARILLADKIVRIASDSCQVSSSASWEVADCAWRTDTHLWNVADEAETKFIRSPAHVTIQLHHS